MNTQFRFGKFFLVLVMALLAMLGAGVVRADEGLPVTTLADGRAPAPAGPPAAPIASGETIVPASPNPSYYRLYLSTPGNGNIGNITYSDEDVLSYKPSTGQWIKTFDGSNAGLPAAADIDALAYHVSGIVTTIYMSFTEPVNVPTLGLVDDSDVIARAITLTTSSWQMVFDGSQYGLTTAGEDVDGFELMTENEYLISTTGAFTVPGHYGDTVKGTDEDLIYYVSGGFHFKLDGSSIGLAGTNDVTSLAYVYSGTEESFLLVTQRAVHLPGLSAAAGHVWVHNESNYGADSNTLFWQITTVPKIDAFDLRMEN